VRRTSTLVATALIFAAGCSYFGHTSRYEPRGVRAAGGTGSGNELFQRDCAWCHGAAAQGTTRGPDLTTGQNGPALTDFMLSTGRMPLTDTGERATRRAPAYSPQEIDEIVRYVASLGARGPDVPVVDPAAGTLAEGEDLYQANCAACHSASGIGGTLAQGSAPAVEHPWTTSDITVPGVRRATAAQIAEAVRTGPGAMPVFDDKTLSAQQVDSIALYIGRLQRQRDRGGLPIGRTGPVSEGAVAWVIGIGVLLLFTRWIGSTTRSHG